MDDLTLALKMAGKTKTIEEKSEQVTPSSASIIYMIAVTSSSGGEVILKDEYENTAEWSDGDFVEVDEDGEFDEYESEDDPLEDVEDGIIDMTDGDGADIETTGTEAIAYSVAAYQEEAQAAYMAQATAETEEEVSEDELPDEDAGITDDIDDGDAEELPDDGETSEEDDLTDEETDISDIDDSEYTLVDDESDDESDDYVETAEISDGYTVAECIGSVNAGDRVAVMIQDGKLTVIGVVGSGDEQRANTGAAQETADDAKKIANAGAKKINTHLRSFTKERWQTYGAVDKSTSWITGTSYDNTHISVGDIAYITGKVTDAGGNNDVYAMIYGKVTSVTTDHVVMTAQYYIMGGEGGAYEKATEASKVATNYMEFEGDYGDGLVIGDLTKSILGYNTHILSDRFDIRLESKVLASYRADAIYLGMDADVASIYLCGDSPETAGAQLWNDGTEDGWNRLCMHSDNAITQSANGMIQHRVSSTPDSGVTEYIAEVQMRTQTPWMSNNADKHFPNIHLNAADLNSVAMSSHFSSIDLVQQELQLISERNEPEGVATSMMSVTPNNLYLNSKYYESGNTSKSTVNITSNGVFVNGADAVYIEAKSELFFSSQSDIEFDGSNFYCASDTETTFITPEFLIQGNRTQIKSDTEIGSRTGYNDGKEGIHLDDEGFIQIQRNNSSYHPYISFYLNGSTSTSDGTVRVNQSTGYMEFMHADRYTFDANVHIDGHAYLKNGYRFYGCDSSGTVRSLIYLNDSDSTIVGYGGYSGKVGSTTVYGYDELGLNSANAIRFKINGTNAVTINTSSDGLYVLSPSSNGGAALGYQNTRWQAVNANILRTYDESTTSNGVNAKIYNNRIYRDSSSSERYKRDIAPISAKDIAPERLYDAEVVQFKYKDGYLVDEDSRCDKLMPGFIVEKLKEVYPIAIDYNEDGLPEMWNANILLPAMLKLIQDLKRRIDEQNKIINKSLSI